MKHVVVVGAGLAGLTAAEALTRAGARVTVCEARDVPGGRVGTPERFDLSHEGRPWSFAIEHGIHGVWRQYRNLRALLARYGLRGHLVDGDRQELVVLEPGDRPRFLEVGASVRRSRMPEPLCLLGMFRGRDFLGSALRSSPLGYLAAGRDVAHAFAFDAEHDVALYDGLTVGEYIARWPPTLRHLFSALSHSALFLPPEECCLVTFFHGLNHYVIGDKRDVGFDYFDADPGSLLLRPMVDRVVAAGGAVRLSTPVRGVLGDSRGTTGVMLDEGPLPADAVVLAADPPGTHALAGEPVARALAGYARPGAVGSTVVRVWFTRAPGVERASNGMYAGPALDAYFWVHRFQPAFADWARATGGGVVECHLYGAHHDDACNADDADVIAGVTASLEQAWPVLRGAFVTGHVRRNPTTHVAFRPGVYGNLPPSETCVPGLTMCGDWVEAPYPVFYLERTVVTGLEAARAAAKTLLLPYIPDAPLPPFPFAPGSRRFQRVARTARNAGLLPRLGGPRTA